MEVLKVRCPECGKIIVYSLENAFRPFCSERCKLLDLGAWANEDYKVPTQEQPPEDDSQDSDQEKN